MRQLSFNVSIVNDNIPEDAEMVSTTLYPADRERIGNHVTVSPDVATVTIQDDDGKHFIALSSNTYTFTSNQNNQYNNHSSLLQFMMLLTHVMNWCCACWILTLYIMLTKC